MEAGNNVFYFEPRNGYLIFGDIVTKEGKNLSAEKRQELLARRVKEIPLEKGILAAVADPSARLSAAWNLFEAARAAGDPAGLAQAADRLGRLFPGSPETAIARSVVSGTGSRVSEAPSPILFVVSGAPAANVPGPAAPAAAPAAKTFSVQAGSFQVRENADELVKDLARAGFAAIVRDRPAGPGSCDRGRGANDLWDRC